MIDYSTNLMGPINTYWYQERNLEVGTVAAGRIDIRGLDESIYYGGMYEYDLPPMRVESWYRFTEWLDEFVTDELWSLEDIVSEFEKDNEAIEWV
jgi:hypothetical protein